MGFADSSMIAKIAFFVSILGLLMVLVGLATPAWTVVSISDVSASIGLFQRCVASPLGSACVSIQSGFLTDWWRATQAMALIGFLLGLADLVVLGIYVFLKNEMKVLQMAGLALAFATGTVCLIAVIIWGSYSSGFGYSFGLEIFGALLYIAVGVTLTIGKVMVG